MHFEVRGTKAGKSGRWKIEASSATSARRKAAVAGVDVTDVIAADMAAAPAAPDLSLSGRAIALMIVVPAVAAGAGIWLVLRPHPSAQIPSPTIRVATAEAKHDAASPPTTGPARAEIALKVIPASLRASLAAPAQLSVVSPASAPVTIAKGRVVGAAWLERNNGSSDVLRGLEVRLMRATVSGEAVAAGLGKTAETWDEQARRARQEADDDRRHYGGTVMAYTAKDDEARARESDRKGADARKAARDLKGTMDVGRAFRVLMDRAAFEVEDSAAVVAEGTIEMGKTGIDGKFSLPEVAAGDYYVFAWFSTRTLHVEWLVPVHLGPGATVEVNLDNENTFVIKNLRG